MKRAALIFLFFFVLTTPITYSCQRIDTVKIEGDLKTFKLTDLKGVPLEYGKLVSVTSPSNHPDWAHLWFEDKDKIIRMVRVGFTDNRLHEKVTEIPRN